MLDRVKEIIQKNWGEWFPDPAPRRPAFAKIAGNSLADGRVILLVFTENDRSPRLIIKIPRSPNQVDTTHQEYTFLTQLHHSVGGDLAASLPRPLHYETLNDVCLYFESAVVGKMMGNLRSPWHVSDGYRTRRQTARNVNEALNWLSDLHQQTATNYQSMDRRRIENWADLTILRYRPIGAAPEHVLHALEIGVERLVDLLEGQELPLSCEHGDYWAGNIVLTKRGMGVIDWADARFDRPPLYDAFFFVNSYALGFSPRSSDSLWMFKSLLDSESWFAQSVGSALTRYSESVRLNPQAAPYLIGLAAARKAFRETLPAGVQTRQQRLLDLWARWILEKAP